MARDRWCNIFHKFQQLGLIQEIKQRQQEIIKLDSNLDKLLPFGGLLEPVDENERKQIPELKNKRRQLIQESETLQEELLKLDETKNCPRP